MYIHIYVYIYIYICVCCRRRSHFDNWVLNRRAERDPEYAAFVVSVGDGFFTGVDNAEHGADSAKSMSIVNIHISARLLLCSLGQRKAAWWICHGSVATPLETQIYPFPYAVISSQCDLLGQ